MDDWGCGFPSGADLNGNGAFDPGDMEIWHDIENGEYNRKPSHVTSSSYISNNDSSSTTPTGIWWLDIILWLIMIIVGPIFIIAMIGVGIVFPPLGMMLIVMFIDSLRK